MIIRSRVILPISRAPIEDGAVIIKENHVAAVGRWRDLYKNCSEPLVDLGDAVLLPGLVNTHCHLDYTEMAGWLPPSSFPDWVKGIMAYKASWSYTDYADSWIRGAKMLLQTGTTTVADIEAVPELLPEVWTATPLRVHSFLELTCVKNHAHSEQILREAVESIYRLKPRRGVISLSPHALYSTSPRFLQEVGAACRKERWRMTMHVAESPEEFDMYHEGAGSLYEWLKRQRDMSDCGQGTPVAQIERCGLLNENFLAVHANYLKPEDISLFAQYGVNVVHCPRSHRFFGYKAFPYQKLVEAGVKVSLGTDSLASVGRTRGLKPELSLFAEMEQFMSANPGVPSKDVLEMATVNGAQALGLKGKAGEICEGAYADLIALDYTGNSKDAYDAVANNWRYVKASMIHGQWAIRPE